ncbi:MAG: WD40/YVTN/BNR-like repeat-containing protein, partial [Phycisphaerae bacterium]
MRGSYVSVQVNVDELGQNIWADAANEPSIAVDPTNSNNIVIGWRQFDTLYSSFRQAGWAYSHDGGRTWTFPGVLEPEVFRSDPVLAADADGNFYYYSVPFSGPGDDSLFKSLDGGETWPDPVSAFGGDKPWMTIDRTGGMSHGNIYAAWGSQFTRSVDGGASFMEPVDSGLSFGFVGTVAVGPDGAVYIINTNLGVVRSANAQDPLSAPAFIPTTVDLGGWPEFGWPANPAGLMGQPWIAVDYSDSPRHGHVYVLSSVNTGSRLDVTFARAVSTGGSSDCCYPHDAAGCDDPSCEATICADAPECCSDTWYDWCSDGALFTCAACPAWAWSTPVRVNDDPADTDANHWFGMMSVAPSGRIDAVWNDTRNTGVATVSELFYAYSLDGGNTWSKNVALSPPFDTTVGWPQQWKIGDYYDMVSDDLGARVAYAATFNGEQDVYFLRIGQFDCNNNAVGDLDDIADGTSNDCSGNGIPDECEPDCNGNGVPDSCDIVDGTSVDCNGNGVPDACDLAGPIGEDCNGNGTLDSCDIAAGDSPDCNGNARPDECDLAGGDALDCNDNGVPDTCDIDDGGAVDCNGNTVPDACDIAFGPSVDMDGNGVPDECEGSVLYVNVDATGMQNGTTWADAYVDLQSALNTAAASSDSVGEIWVAQGMYRPDIAGGDREASFELVSGVVLYGGFAGGEDTLDERDPEKNPTTLSGDLNDDDIGFENRSDNSYHVVTAMDVDDTAVLDGFIV